MESFDLAEIWARPPGLMRLDGAAARGP